MKRLILLLCLCVSTGLASQPARNPIQRNILIFFDPQGAEGPKGALTTELQAAIKFTTDVIIIATTNVFLNVVKLGTFLGNSLQKFDQQLYESADLIILIPKGLKDSSGLNNFKSVTEELLKKNIFSRAKVENLEKLFAPDPNKKYEWYIALNGHGIYTKRSVVVSFQEDIAALYGGLSSDLGVIAGMQLGDFQRFLRFLNDKINTKVLYFNSCYAGELNLSLAFSNVAYRVANNLILKSQLKPNYDIISGALTGAVTSVPGEQYERISQVNSAQAVEGLIDFQGFFTLAHDYFGKQKGSKRINDEKFIELCSALDRWSIERYPDRMIFQLPQVKFKHQDFFRAVPLNNKIFILDDIVVKRHMLAVDRTHAKPKIVAKREAIDLARKEFVLLYASEVEVPLRLAVRMPQLVSMIAGPAVHVFDSIEDWNDVFTFVKGQMTIPNIVPKYYLIKKMNEYSNVLLHVQAKPTVWNQPHEDVLKSIFCYCFKNATHRNGRHYLTIFYKDGPPIELMIPGSQKLDKEIQVIIDSIASLAHASLEKRVRELTDLFLKLLETLNETANLESRKNERSVGMFLEALAYYSNDRKEFETASSLYRVFEKQVLSPDQKIIKQFNDLLAHGLLAQIAYPKVMQMFTDLEQRAHVYLIENPSNAVIARIEKIAQGFTRGTLEGKLEIAKDQQAMRRKTDLAIRAGAIADSLIAQGKYQEAIDRLIPFTPLTSTKILKIYNAWINKIKNSNWPLAQIIFKQAIAQATQLEDELKNFSQGVMPTFQQEKSQLLSLTDFFKDKPQPKENPESQYKPNQEAPDQSGIRHRIVRQYNEMLSEDPTIIPYEDITELWENMSEKARKYLGQFGFDEKILSIKTIADGLGTIQTVEGKLAIKDNENAKRYYQKLRDNEVKKANSLIEQGNYVRAIDLLRPFTPDTSAKILKTYIKMIEYLAKESKRRAHEQAQDALKYAKILEKEFDFFGGVAPQFKTEKAALEKLYNDLR